MILVAALLATLLFSEVSYAENLPIIAFGNRTYVAETTKSGGTVLVRVYRRTSSTTLNRYSGFTVPTKHFAAHRAEVKHDPGTANAAERVYFTGRIIGSTPFKPSSPLTASRVFSLGINQMIEVLSTQRSNWGVFF